ncbi:Phosphate regulon transcriptional regulatory protein PhoB [Poriferisphaera corsica]|uniref:Phosphate regulon transcriptional regulatory protein PhoB n=1 Tax=Poriferisphaera corsica TaxID=2528020 RepID=A0A517YQG3_9BACT|nr:response regulator transcription factor [Poriferisphaera corsica]QDU32451.1 Phosphate regulon transcriptional regulatory protein PhoB [Poriferisphaera corsica]
MRDTSSTMTTPTGNQQEELTTILLVEDEQDLLELLKYNLNREGFNTITAMTGEEGLKQVRSTSPDLILLDLMLPAMDGLEVCRTLKSREHTANIPVIMLTARGEESDIVRGLEMGADDYITKPFSPRILMARIRAVLRRAEAELLNNQSGSTMSSGGIHIDPDRHEVIANGEAIDMTATEFKLLSLIMSKPGRVFTRQQIIETIHEGFAAVTDRSVDVQVVALRRKLKDAGRNIETVRGVGYRFKE